MKKKYSLVILYLLLFIYLEFINKILLFNKLPGKEFFDITLFSLSISFLLSLITKSFKIKTNKNLCSAIVIILTSIYLADYIYNSMFSLNSLPITRDILAFYKTIFYLIKTNFINLFIYSIPIFIYILFQDEFDYTKRNNANRIKTSILFIVTYIISLICLKLL